MPDSGAKGPRAEQKRVANSERAGQHSEFADFGLSEEWSYVMI
jgi:hypothetical protein